MEILIPKNWNDERLSVERVESVLIRTRTAPISPDLLFLDDQTTVACPARIKAGEESSANPRDDYFLHHSEVRAGEGGKSGERTRRGNVIAERITGR
ncbi:hypothetical protein K0M31_009042 [Melipona bicolor]|uniref:Uncharacterized protein n=1 Tax=Melipona bicolor TaxID=60889 RepID=A0AA40FNX4_9HYME|nr:hypothetical protein K0M31_009042 [Melipona bicolor]